MSEHYVLRLFTDQETANEAFAYVVAFVIAMSCAHWFARTPVSSTLGLLTALYATPYFRRYVGHDPGKWRVALYVFVAVIVFGLIGHYEAVA